MSFPKLPSVTNVLFARYLPTLAVFSLLSVTAPCATGYLLIRNLAPSGITPEIRHALQFVANVSYGAAAVECAGVLLIGLGIYLRIVRPLQRIANRIGEWFDTGEPRSFPLKSWVRETDLVHRLFIRVVSRQDTRLAELVNHYRAVNHDFRNPLQDMTDTAAAFRRGDVPPEELADSVERNVDILTSALAQTSQFMQKYSRINGAPRKRFDAAQLVADGVHALDAYAKTRGIRLTYHRPKTPIIVFAHEKKLATILTNLVTNAIKHTPPNGRIEIATSTVPGLPSGRGAHQTTVPSAPSLTGAVTASQQTSQLTNQLTISIDDTGPGIPEADRERVFDERFRCAASATTPGTGMGLAIVKSLVSDYDGICRCESSPSGGARFTVELPILPPPPQRRRRKALQILRPLLPERKRTYAALAAVPPLVAYLAVLSYEHFPTLGDITVFAAATLVFVATVIPFAKIGFDFIFRLKFLRPAARFTVFLLSFAVVSVLCYYLIRYEFTHP